MNIEARKISLAQLLFNIQREDILDKIEALLKKEGKEEAPSWHKELITERLNNLNEDELDSWDDVKDRLDKKYGASF